eukprot:530712-Lingulodinium_polyedra.AAC.1
MESAPGQVMSAEPVLPEFGVGAARDMPVNAGVGLADAEEVTPLAFTPTSRLCSTTSRWHR